MIKIKFHQNFKITNYNDAEIIASIVMQNIFSGTPSDDYFSKLTQTVLTSAILHIKRYNPDNINLCSISSLMLISHIPEDKFKLLRVLMANEELIENSSNSIYYNRILNNINDRDFDLLESYFGVLIHSLQRYVKREFLII